MHARGIGRLQAAEDGCVIRGPPLVKNRLPRGDASAAGGSVLRGAAPHKRAIASWGYLTQRLACVSQAEMRSYPPGGRLLVNQLVK